MGKRRRPPLSALLGAAAITLVACGSGEVAARSSAPAPSSVSSVAPTTEQSPVECSDVYAFVAAAGPTYVIAAAAVMDGETPEERRTLAVYVSSMALHGVLLSDVPEVGVHFRTVALAAADAQRKLVDGVPAREAIAALNTDEADTARESAVAYRGPC